jgi:uncharacterized membrane protein HdeD (DUF308 family)
MSVVTTREIPRNYWWLVLLRGIISVLFGIVAIVWPGPTLLFLIYLFGAYVLIDGITAVVVAFQERNVYSRWWVILIGGIAGIILGLMVFFWPGETALVLLFLIAAWAIVTGIFEVIAAFVVPPGVGIEWALIAGGVISILLGVVLFFIPRAALLAFVWLIGIFSLIYGVVLIVRAFQYRRLLKA